MNTMNRELAAKIANEHLAKMNPDMWNGVGDMPDSFDNRICTYEIGSDYQELDISFYEEDGIWYHYCELRDKATEELMEAISSNRVDSQITLTDSIMFACEYAYYGE